jgi:hypothetical protein
VTVLEITALVLAPFTVAGIVVVARGFVALVRIGSYPLPPRSDDGAR